jgi:hypothetical protein
MDAALAILDGPGGVGVAPARAARAEPVAALRIPGKRPATAAAEEARQSLQRSGPRWCGLQPAIARQVFADPIDPVVGEACENVVQDRGDPASAFAPVCHSRSSRWSRHRGVVEFLAPPCIADCLVPSALGRRTTDRHITS